MQTPCKSWLVEGSRLANRLVLASLVLAVSAYATPVLAKESVHRKLSHTLHKSEKKTKVIAVKPNHHKIVKSSKALKKVESAKVKSLKPARPKATALSQPTPKLALKAKRNKALSKPPVTHTPKSSRLLTTLKTKRTIAKARVKQSAKPLKLTRNASAKLAKLPLLMPKTNTIRIHPSKQRVHNPTQVASVAKLSQLKRSTKPPKTLAPKPSVSLQAKRPVPQTKPEKKSTTGRVLQVGTASYYGTGFHGGRTANGERFNQNDLTCAHNGLPFGCKIRVTNLRNQKSVDVRVNDRGGFAKHGRVVDLSKAAAGKIGMLGTGTAKVKIEVVH